MIPKPGALTEILSEHLDEVFGQYRGPGHPQITVLPGTHLKHDQWVINIRVDVMPKLYITLNFLNGPKGVITYQRGRYWFPNEIPINLADPDAIEQIEVHVANLINNPPKRPRR